MSFLYYISRPEILAAVVVPSLITLGIFLNKNILNKYHSQLCLAYLLSLPLMYVTARWEITEETQFLFILPFFAFFCFYLSYKRIEVSPSLAYALTFISGLLIDVLCAIDLSKSMEPGQQSRFYEGVGGAGFQDGLFILPILSYFVIQYVRHRQNKPFSIF